MMRGRNHSTRFNGRHQPHPDTMSITSSCIEESSVVSGSVVADSLPSPDADSLQSFSTISSQSSEPLSTLKTLMYTDGLLAPLCIYDM